MLWQESIEAALGSSACKAAAPPRQPLHLSCANASAFAHAAALGISAICDHAVLGDQARAHPHPALPAPSLDALLGTGPTIALLSPTSVRLVRTAHFQSPADELPGCRAAPGAPLVIRVHSYCADHATASSSATAIDALVYSDLSPAAPLSAIPASDLAGGARAIEGPVRVAACQLDAFLSVPSLCGDAVYGDATPHVLERLLESVYSWGRSGFGVATTAARRELTYGEVSQHAIFSLVRGDVFPRAHALSASSTLVDVGSGVGKLVLGVAALTNATVAGVEVDEVRHNLAVESLAEAVRAGHISAGRAARVRLLHADAAALGALPADATHVFLSDLCFPDELAERVVKQVTKLPRLQCVLSLRRWSANMLDGAESCRLEHVRTLTMAMTWTDAQPVECYCCAEAAKGRVAL